MLDCCVIRRRGQCVELTRNRIFFIFSPLQYDNTMPIVQGYFGNVLMLGHCVIRR